MLAALSRFRRSAPLGRRSAVTLTLLAFAVVVVVVTIFVLTAVTRVSDYANRFDDARSRQTTEGALQTFKAQLHATLNDYAAWDDAANYVYAPDGDEWMVSNFGDMTANSNLFDVALVIDAQERVIMAFQDGKPVGWKPRDYFDASLFTLYDNVRSVGAGLPEAVGFMETRDGVAAVGVALIRQKSGSLDKLPQEHRFLIFARHLSDDSVAKLASTYVVEGLHYAGPQVHPATSVEIRNPHGMLLARLGWVPRHPGDLAFEQVRLLVYGALAMVGLFFLLLFVSGTKTLNRLRADEAAARSLAMSDKLSGLLNRTGFFAALDALVAEGQSRKVDVVLLYLDLDGFKEVNDAYGHATGDKLIRSVAAGLKSLVGGDAVLARVGGDEFAIAFAADLAKAPAEELSDRILGFFDEPFAIGERVAIVGTSIGIAISPLGRVSGEELVRRADMAMYHSKESGRGRFSRYSSDMDAEREERNRLEVDLRLAIEQREIEVVFQPVVDAGGWQLIGVEALARWNRKGHGPVPPDVFIPVAEASGLIDKLGIFVLHRACETLQRWPGVKLAVNISPGQFRDPSFALQVASVLRRTCTEPSCVTLEMTEGYLIQNPERARTALGMLKDLGVNIALDDFGAGFASIGYLRQFGFDRMKIDKSLVAGVESGGKDREMLQATVSLARSLDIPVTAEGVETEGQALHLRAMGCDELQGYFFSRPVGIAAVDQIYRSQSGPAREAVG